MSSARGSQIVCCTLLVWIVGAWDSMAQEQVKGEANRRRVDLTISGRRPLTAASHQVLWDRDLAFQPRERPGDLLRLVPGLVTAQHAGGGKAEQTFLRGFDNDHGTDIAMFVDGIPVNMVSHAHGQGYADLHFVIPETLLRMDVVKGPYTTEAGNLAVSGTVNFVTRSKLEETVVEASGGSFGTYRALAMARAPIPGERSFFAAEVYSSDGPFDHPQGLKRYNLLWKSELAQTGHSRLTLLATSFASGWNASGQIPLREVQAERLSRFGAIDPTEGGSTERHNLSLTYSADPQPGQSFLAQAYLFRYRLALFSNFTFFDRNPLLGDGIEQDDARLTFGGQARQRWEHAAGTTRTLATTLGLQWRNDDITLALRRQRQRKRLGDTNLVDIRETNLAAYLQEEFLPWEWLRLVVGVRADHFLFTVDDKQEVTSSSASATSGTLQKAIASPKASVIVSPSDHAEVFLNFGQGFHSNDARAVVRQQGASVLPKATGVEVGLRHRGLNGRLETTVAGWGLDLEREFVFAGDEGTTEEKPRSRRAGVDVGERLRLFNWLWADIDVTLAQAKFRDSGGAVPLAPNQVISGSLTAWHLSGARGSLRIRSVGRRNGTEDRNVPLEGYTVVDLLTGYRKGAWELGVTVENLFNTAWREAQFVFPSRLAGEPASVQDIHFTPGSPIGVRGSLRCYF